MKLNKSSQLFLLSAASLLVAGVMSACSSATLDFVFVSSSLAAGPNSYGEIDVFEINRVSGFMKQIPESPFPSGGRDPVAMAVTPDYTTLYVVNQLDNNIVHFMIGPDGKLYPQSTVNTPGNYPLALAVDGSNVIVVDTFQPLASCSLAAPCSGSVAVFPILTAAQAQALTPAETANSLGQPVTNTKIGASYWPLTNPQHPSDIMVPTAVNVLHGGAYVYVTAYDSASVAATNSGTVNICNLSASAYTGAVGYVFGFSVGSNGALTALPGSPYSAGSLPCGVASDPSGGYVYVTDYIKGDVLSFSVTSGALTPLGNPVSAGNQPLAIAVDPTYPYAYVANSEDGSVSAYEYSTTTGALSRVGTYATGIDPVAIGIDPSASHFVFTANFLGNNVSDFQMNTTTGALVNAQRSPYTSNAQPTSVAAVPHNGLK